MHHTAVLTAFLRSAVDTLHVDRRRVHVSGYSQGATVTWQILCHAPELVCSIAPLESSGLSYWGPGYVGQCFSEGNKTGPATPRSVLFTNGLQDPFSLITQARQQVQNVISAYNLSSAPRQTLNGFGFNASTWKRNDVGDRSPTFTFYEHNYTITDGPWAFYKGHCFPTTKKDGCESSQGDGHRCCGDFTWADVALDFFQRNPCAQ